MASFCHLQNKGAGLQNRAEQPQGSTWHPPQVSPEDLGFLHQAVFKRKSGFPASVTTFRQRDQSLQLLLSAGSDLSPALSLAICKARSRPKGSELVREVL